MLTFFDEEVVEKLHGFVMQAMVDAAFDPYVLLLRERLSTLSPPASAPGEAPHHQDIPDRDDTSLIDAIYIWPMDDECSVHVGSTEMKALYLEMGTATMAPRPVWIDTLLRCLALMEKQIVETARDDIIVERQPTYRDGDNANPLSIDKAQPGQVATGKQKSIP